MLARAVLGGSLLAAAFAGVIAGAKQVPVSRFAQGEIEDWERRGFQGRTNYQLVEREGRHVLRAQSERSASGLYKTVNVDLTRTPYLTWSWRIDKTLGALDETRRAGDDYAARVYVIFSEGWWFWRSRSICYVWANKKPAGSDWPNAFTSTVRMLALRSGDAQAGRWQSEKRNVREDHRRLFGHDVGRVDVVALMTDTDNSQGSATAYYGEIYFSSE